MTATVIDSLLVTLGLDTSQFDANAKRTLEELQKFRNQNVKLTQQVVDANKKTAESFRSVKNEVLGLIASYFGLAAIKSFIQSNVEGQAALGRMSRNLDISARRLEAWGTVAEEMGDKATDSFGALQTVAQGLAEATIKGHSALTDAARANGVVLTDQKGQLLSSEEIILRFSARMAQLPRQQAIALANMAGLGSISNELLLGPEELRRRLTAAESLSRITEDSTRKAEELQKKWADLRKRLKGIGEGIFEKLEPVLERLTDQFETWVKGIDWDKVIAKVAKFAEEVDNVVQKFGGWQTVAAALAIVLGAQLVGPLVGLIGLVARLGGLLPGVTGGLSAMGAAAGGLAISAAGAAAIGLGAAAYSPSLGGKQRADGSYEDERPRNPSGEPTNNDLWDTIAGKKSAYPGDREQAAQILAYRSYVDPMSKSTYDSVATDILTGKVTDKTAWLANSRRETGPQAGSPTAVKPSVPVSASKKPVPSDLQAYFSGLEASNGLPPGTLAAVWHKESAGSTGKITSSKGAQGPFQFMPETAADYGLAGDDVNDVNKSAAAAARYLGDLRKRYGGDATMMLAAYNWGPGNLEKKGLANAPAETRDYIKMAQGLAIGPSAGQPRSAPSPTSTSTTSVQIDKIEVHTQATDATGIAAALPGALRQRGIVAASDTGVE